MAPNLTGLVLDDPEGNAVPVEQLVGHDARSPRWLVIQAIRYYG